MRAHFKKSEISFLNPRLPANISSRLIFSGQSPWITLGKYHEIDSGNAAGRRCVVPDDALDGRVARERERSR